MWPAAQMPRRSVSGSVSPQSQAGMKSQSSTQEKAASKTALSTLRQCQIFDQNHSEE